MGYEIEVEIEEAGPPNATEADAERSEPYIFILIQTLLLIFRFAVARQRREVMRLLQHSELGRIFRLAADDEIDDDDDDADFNPRWRRRRRPKPDPNRFPKVPSDEGTELMNSGIFGSNEAQMVSSSDRNSIGKKKRLAMRVLERELATESYAKRKVNQRLMAQVRVSVLMPYALG
jgi:WD repeat-containing protein 23